MIYFFSFYQLPTSSLLTVFHAISYQINKSFSINSSDNVLLFGELNRHYKDWLTYSCGTDRPAKLLYNFTIPNNLPQIINSPTMIPS